MLEMSIQHYSCSAHSLLTYPIAIITEVGRHHASGNLQTPPTPFHNHLPLTSLRPCNHWITTSANSNPDQADCTSLPPHPISPRGHFISPHQLLITQARGNWCRMVEEEQGGTMEEFLLAPCSRFPPRKMSWLRPQRRIFQLDSAKVVSTYRYCIVWRDGESNMILVAYRGREGAHWDPPSPRIP